MPGTCSQAKQAHAEVGLPRRRDSHGGGASTEEGLPRRWGFHGGAPTEVGLPRRWCSHRGGTPTEVILPQRRSSHRGGAPMEVGLPQRRSSHRGGDPTEEGLPWTGVSLPLELSLRTHWIFQVLRVTCSLPNPAHFIPITSFFITTTIQI